MVRIMQKIGGRAALFARRKNEQVAPPALREAARFPYGPFQFKTQLPKGTAYTIQACTDLKTWNTILEGVASEATIDCVDSEAHEFSYRFYRLVAGEVASLNVIGYVSTTLPPGFSMIANPLDAPNNTVAEMLKGWPDGATFSKFDTRFFKLAENTVKGGKWTNPGERLGPGEGGIFFNPTEDYKSLSFAGEVRQGNLSVPIPAGFSIRSSLVPLPGSLHEDLGFPIADGDVIHLFDRERQKYVLHPYEEGQWKAATPFVGVGESFWVAKAEPGNWEREFVIAG
jgi:hypothetical protein